MREKVKHAIRFYHSGPSTSSISSCASPSKTCPSNTSPVDTTPSDTSLSETVHSDTAHLDPVGNPSGVAHQQELIQSCGEPGYDAQDKLMIYVSSTARLRKLGELCHEPTSIGRIIPADLSLDTFKRAIMEPDDSNFHKPVYIHHPDEGDIKFVLEGDSQFQWAVDRLMTLKALAYSKLRIWV